MKIYCISDTHFGHDKMWQVYGRPENFGSRILNNIGGLEGDLLIHCGDFCIGNDEMHHESFMIQARNFKKKVLVRGNHDSKSDAWYYAHGWDFVCEVMWLNQFGKQIMFTHMPFMKPSEGTFSPHFSPDILVHGHLHGHNDRHGYHSEIYDTSWFYDLAPEANDYKAVNLEDIVRELSTLQEPK